ncbi:hypothetical protein DMB45_04650 [Sanguibacteroides justesenii]|nr:hypothetical protein DMB45_04650 [Sanguibacteroides justesenii]
MTMLTGRRYGETLVAFFTMLQLMDRYILSKDNEGYYLNVKLHGHSSVIRASNLHVLYVELGKWLVNLPKNYWNQKK